MYKANLIATVTKKDSKENPVVLEVMEMKYKIKDNVLWITDYRGHIMDFDLDEYDVEIKMAGTDNSHL